ncbi:MAG TPA: hypothetical protein VF758_00855, partial [Candidatus Acidoferrum sp.]
MKSRIPASTHKKVVIELLEKKLLRGYLNPSALSRPLPVDLLTPDGQHHEVPLATVRAIYFVRDLDDDHGLDRKNFLSRPKLDGLWVRLRFRDGDSLEGVIPNDLLSFLDNGLHLTPPDFNSNTDRIFVPRSALTELTVLGVVGVARRKPAAAPAQPRHFSA